MNDWKRAAYRDYKWIVRDPDLLGGKLAVCDTRLSVAFLLGCPSRTKAQLESRIEMLPSPVNK